MNKEKINEITIHYLLGGIFPLILLFPFLIESINSLYEAIYEKSLTNLDSAVILSFVVFIFITIVFESSLMKIKKYDLKDASEGMVKYNLFASFYSLIEIPTLLFVFHVNIWICLISGIITSVIFFYIHKYITKLI